MLLYNARLFIVFEWRSSDNVQLVRLIQEKDEFGTSKGVVKCVSLLLFPFFTDY